MGCAGNKEEIVSISPREIFRVFENVEDPFFDKIVDFGVKDSENTENFMKFGFFDVEEPGQGDQAGFVKPFRGIFQPPDNVSEICYVPGAEIKIEYVFGYSSEVARQNVYYVRNSSLIVYSAGTLGVVLNVLNNTQHVFGGSPEYGHAGEIRALALHPDKNIIATGEFSKKPKILIWQSEKVQQTLKTLPLPKNCEGVTCLSFSSNGQFLLSSLQTSNQFLQIWDWEKSEKIYSQTLSVKAILDLSWSITSLTFSVVGERFIGIWTSSSSKVFNFSECFPEKGFYVITCVKWIKNHAFTGSKDGKVCKWDKNDLMISEQVHSPYAVHCMIADDSYLYTGGRDMTVKTLDNFLYVLKTVQLQSIPRAIDFRGSRLLCGLLDGSILEVDDDVKVLVNGLGDVVCGLAVSMSRNLFFTVSKDCFLKSWNWESKKLVEQIYFGKSPLGVECKERPNVLEVQFESDALAIGFDDGTLMIFESDLLRKREINQVKDPIKALAFSNEFLVAGCKSGFLHIFSVPDFSLNYSLQMDFSSIKSIDWSKNYEIVQICSNHLEVAYLSVKNGEKLENSEPLIFNEIWETWTSRAGWHVEKIFDDISDFSFIKTVTRSWSCKFLALGKDLGEVQISSFPYRPGCQERVYTGHSSKIHNLKWTKSDDYLLSCSSDRLIIQWKVEK